MDNNREENNPIYPCYEDCFNDNYPLAFNEKFEYIDFRLDQLQNEINDIDSGLSINSASLLRISQNTHTGEILISLLNHNEEVLDTKSITLTGKLIKSAYISLQEKTLNIVCLDDSEISLDISTLIDDYNNKISEVAQNLANEITRAQNVEATKVDKVIGKGLSTNDFSDAYKTKLDNVEANAQVNVIESIKVDNATLPINDKSVNIDLSNKVDKIEGKGLSENDFTNALKSDLEANTNARHTHSNKSILDEITASFTTQDKSNLDDNTSARHTHANKSLLDTYTQSEENLASAVAKMHTHDNKAILDATTASFTDASYVHTDNNYTTQEKTKLESIESGAEVNTIVGVQVDGSDLSIDENRKVNVVISGKQDKIDALHKLDADLVDDSTSTNKFATSEQLSQIATNTYYISLKANSEDVYNKSENDALLAQKANASSVYTSNVVDTLLNAKQDKLSQFTAFVNKGSATKVAQVSTNSLGQVVNVEEIVIDALPGSTRVGQSLVASFVGSTSVLTLTLKDQNNNILTTQNIDLGVQSVIVSGTYDSSTNSIILTLSSGSTITIPVTGLVDGLVPNSRTIAGINLVDDISLSELENTLFTITSETWDDPD